ncbi:VWA domain-containing protein [Vineibacter terrae]|nr:VWA domain-containing protein [Vineibacter terrae]
MKRSAKGAFAMPDAFPFHFLRPWWLIALLPAIAMLVQILRRDRAEAQWRGAIEPHLLKHLVVRPQGLGLVRPAHLVAAALVIGTIALAGPSWRRELPPFVEDKAPLMIALDVSASMGGTDVAPSRLERAKQKIRDLLGARAGARTGLVAYAGSAHLVMPLTDDRAVIEPFLMALAPGLMPVQGKKAVAALTLAAGALAPEPVAGTILLVADDVVGADAAAVQQAAGRNGVVILRVMQPGAAGQMDSSLRSQSVAVTVDDDDIHTLEGRIETHYQAAQAEQVGARWRDEGYWLVLPVALLGLFWFRRGSTVPWVLLVAFALAPAPPARAQEQAAPKFLDLWLTLDQQGRLAFDRGDNAAAAKLFTDPMWRGIAAYRAFDYLAAAEAFRKIDTVEGHFALGNAEAHNHAWEKAIKAYEEVLAAQPGHAAAKQNLAIVRAALEAAEAKRRKEEKGEQPPDMKADETKVDPKQKGGKRVEVQPQDVTTEGAAEAWMRAVQTSPADFLKLKFAIQAAKP